MKVGSANLGEILASVRRIIGLQDSHANLSEQERTRRDPKDGELCLARMKSGETLMEVRSGSDVQIDHRSWV